MALTVYNTLKRAKEKFEPINAGKVNMFVCGPTVYDYSHLGHAKTYTQFDFIARYLRFKGFKVFYLQNITDIDDKIIKKAGEAGISASELAAKNDQIYREDMLALHNTAVTEYAKATDRIPEIVSQVKTLVSKGFAYKIKDGYYFDLKKFHDYGRLSGRKTLQENDSVSRIDENPEKKNKGDFCLWKFNKTGEPFWETELGAGRPGWHIEDTAITEKYFGVQYDLHGGAIDLIFPHHEAEIAQQESASGKKPFVKYWMHTAFLNINAEKMAKSKGNYLTIRDVLKNYNYAVLRFFFISNHYRTQIDFNENVLDQAKKGLERLNEFVRKIDRKLDDRENEKIIAAFKEKFYGFIDDDFDTPKAFAELFDLIRKINAKGVRGIRVYSLMDELENLFDFLKIYEDKIPAEISKLVEKRKLARKNNDWQESDQIRNQIRSKGWIVEDKKDGQKLKKA